MTTVAIRGKSNRKGGTTLLATEEARKRAAEHLKEMGVDVDRLPKLVWPEGAVSASKSHRFAPWQYTTRDDLLRQRRARMEEHLRYKRYHKTRRAAYVEVFYLPGPYYMGWHRQLVGVGISQGGINEPRLMELFPLVEPTLFGPPDFEEWMIEFARRHRRGTRFGKPYGKAPVWVEVAGETINEIISVAEWPSEKGGRS